MIYFLIVFIFLLFYAILAWYRFQYAFYFLLFYIPFQVALNPPISDIDVATGRIMILILFGALVVKESLVNAESISLTFYTNWHKTLTFVKSDHVSQLLLIFLLWAGVSIFWSDYWLWGLRKWLVFASIFPLYWVTYFSLNAINQEPASLTPRRLPTMIMILAVSGALISLTAIFQFLGQFIFDKNLVLYFWKDNFFPVFLGKNFGNIVFHHQSWFTEIFGRVLMRAVGFFPDPHTFGFYLGLILPLALACIFLPDSCFKKIKILPPFIIFVLSAAVFFTFSRSTYIGFPVGLLVFLTLGYKFLGIKQKIILLSFTVILFLGLAFLFVFSASNLERRESNVERLRNLQEALVVIKEKTVLGTGIGSYPIYVYRLRGEPINYRTPIYAHNTYLDIWAELGLVGLMIWLAIFGWLFYSAIKRIFLVTKELPKRQERIYLVGIMSSLSWFLVQGLFDTMIYSPWVLPILMVILAGASKIISSKT